MRCTAIKEITVFVFDIDGTLTDGRLYLGKDMESNVLKGFSVVDGYGIRKLIRSGISVFTISASVSSKFVEDRLYHLGIERAYAGVENKWETLVSIMKDKRIGSINCAYMGDDENDLDIMSRVGYSGTVPHAPDRLKEVSDFVSKKPAGLGAAREFIERFLFLRERV